MMHLKYKLAFLLVVTIQDTRSVTCPNGGQQVIVNSDIYCYWLSTISGIPDDLHANCQGSGGILAEIVNDEARSIVDNIVSSNSLSRTYIGVKRNPSNINQFVTWMGGPLNYARWDWARNYWNHQPDNTNEKCVTMFPFYWHDDFCNRVIKGICSMRVVMPCSSNPCKNGGTCIDNGPSSYSCECPADYTGYDCQIEIMPCDYFPCLNGGTCTDLSVSDYSCDCDEGFLGKNCSAPGVETVNYKMIGRNKVATSSTITSFVARSRIHCAQQCLSSSTMECKSYNYAEGSQTCYLLYESQIGELQVLQNNDYYEQDAYLVL